ncbi:MAG TPA: hypothetical protein VFR55_09530 [Dehalococcoidia bacterium]|nr:hypothetical protein [Dehalococcoidia bacterium]
MDRKLLLFGALVGIAVTGALYSVGARQRLSEWQARKLARMVERMPEEHPAKRMLNELAAIREQNEKMLNELAAIREQNDQIR